MSATPPPPTPPASAFTLLNGPILIATCFNWMLMGVLALQVYIFSISFTRERAAIKALVYGLFCLDLLQTATTTHYSWFVLVSGWGDITHLMSLPWSGITIALLTGIISGIVQLYFAWRIWVLMRGGTLAIAVCTLITLVALMQATSAVVVAIRFAIFNADVAKIPLLMAGVEVWLVGSFVVDVIIAVAMIAILNKARRGSPWKRTESLITRLIINTVETGAITAITAGVDLALFKIYPQNFLHQVPAYILGKLYTNVVLAILNARKRTAEADTYQNNTTRTPHTAEQHDLTFRGTNKDATAVHVATDITHEGSFQKHAPL